MLRGSLLTITMAFVFCVAPHAASQENVPKPVRNDVAQPYTKEFLVLRHQQLKKGSHDTFYKISREGVWPWFEKIGTRVVGQWQILYPDGGGSDEYDEGYRLARYTGYTHWKDTRTGTTIGGNGPDSAKNTQALRERNEYRLGSARTYHLEGNMAPGGPYYSPGLVEDYEPTTDQPTAEAARPGRRDFLRSVNETPHPVRNDVAQSGAETVTLRYWKIKKGTFDEFNKASIEGVWPFFEKIGARVIGQWKRIYPEEGTAKENSDYDEVLMLTRYASYEHWEASRSPAALGGNGPDYDKLMEAIQFRRSLTIETTLEFLQGHMYHSPPKYMPGLKERYQRKE
jgi:hypothetical protein